MLEGKKLLITENEKIDLNANGWDEKLISFLKEKGGIDQEKAMGVACFLKEQISKMDLGVITIPMIEKIIEAKLMEYGAIAKNAVKLDSSIFKGTRLSLSENALMVLQKRYLKTDENGNVIETPEDMFRRVARHVAMAEEKYGATPEFVNKIETIFYNMMTELRFLPNSPTLMNAGRELGQLAACFVVPVEDSMEGIFDALKAAALIHKSGGGTGFSFSRLRPKNSRVGSTGGVASGPVSFMKIFNTATEQVKQGGTRRGANMAILRVDHPDIMEFIYSKRHNHGNELNNFNISVAVTEEFMNAVKEGKTYDLIDPRTGKKRGELDARKVYQALIEQAWETGDPGIVFLDRLNKDNPTPEIGEIESTNPCGEQPLLPFEACNLGSINLTRFVVKGADGRVKIDYDSLKETVWYAVRFLDNVIDVSRYPLPEIEDMVSGNRKIGLGIMGFADVLFQMMIPYDSEEALELAKEVMAFIQKEAHEASRSLAKERGVFPNFEKSIYKDKQDCRYRNATVTTIAPTGTLSIIAGCSSGIEPIFALCFVRNVMDNDRLLEINPYFKKIAKERGFYSEELMEKIAEKGSIQDIEEIPEEVKRVFVTAHDIKPEWHVKMQAAFQKYTDNAVSKTVNLPHDATVEDVKKVYDLAYQLRLKGITIYRDGSKKYQVLTLAKEKERKDGVWVKERPETLTGFTTKVTTGMGNLYITVTEYEGKPFEVFAIIGKSGRSTTAKTEAIGRLISLCLRAGVGVEEIVEQLKGIGGEYPVFQKDGLVLSIPDAIARVLEKRYLKNKKIEDRKGKHENSLTGGRCPECGERLSFEEGCMKCYSCGFSSC
ncbi:MAG: ribonucleotide-diphosphate reductase subunit alpha [Deltaproteobacteria bacterium]|nr:MAG: ribonucleotide-diphosphate reductase subunit alpha [Deltaproteobacteria bacterium]